MLKLLEAKNLNLRIGTNKVLDDVSFAVNDRDFITIVGPNGAGKTMLLKCLIGIQKPSSGSVERKKDLRIGYAPQKISLSKTFSINVQDFLSLNKDTNIDEVQEIAKKSSIANLLDFQLSSLSGGQIQRVLLARSLVGSPEILILDEPVQNIDISGHLQFYEIINSFYQERKMAILMVSHDLNMVMSSTKKVICLYHHICCQGEPKSITKDPEFISIFGDDMAKMVALYSHEHDHCHKYEKPQEL